MTLLVIYFELKLMNKRYYTGCDIESELIFKSKKYSEMPNFIQRYF